MHPSDTLCLLQEEHAYILEGSTESADDSKENKESTHNTKKVNMNGSLTTLIVHRGSVLR